MDKLLKISIVTITADADDSLSRTVESVARQSYAPIEHIVVDAHPDGRRDGIYGNARCVSDPGRGLYGAINAGLDATTGDVVGLLHGNDCLSDADVIAAVAEVFSKNPDIDFLYGDLAYRRPGSPKVVRRYSARHFTPDKLRYGFVPPHPTLYLRRSVAFAVGAYKEDYRIAADLDFWLRLFAQGYKGYYLQREMVSMSPGGMSWKLSSLLWRNMAERHRALRENGYQTGYFDLCRRYLHIFD